MDSDNEQGYKPRPDFQVEAKEPLIDLSSTDNTELWLIQWPKSKDKEVSFILWCLPSQSVSFKPSFRIEEKKEKKESDERFVTNCNCHVNFVFFRT